MDPEYRTWIADTAEGLDYLASSSRALRDELADMKRIVEERYKLEDIKQAEHDARCREEQAQQAKIIAERQLLEASQKQTSQSKSAHNDQVAQRVLQQQLHLIYEERENSIRSFVLDCKTVQEDNCNQIMAAIRRMRR